MDSMWGMREGEEKEEFKNDFRSWSLDVLSNRLDASFEGDLKESGRGQGKNSFWWL